MVNLPRAPNRNARMLNSSGKAESREKPTEASLSPFGSAVESESVASADL